VGSWVHLLRVVNFNCGCLVWWVAFVPAEDGPLADRQVTVQARGHRPMGYTCLYTRSAILFIRSVNSAPDMS